MGGICLCTYKEFRTHDSDIPLPFLNETKEGFNAKYPCGVLCPHKGCNAKLFCASRNGRAYLKKWPKKSHNVDCIYIKVEKKNNWHSDARIISSLQYQLGRNFLGETIYTPPKIRIPVPPRPVSVKVRTESYITYLRNDQIDDSKVGGIYAVGGYVDKVEIKNEDTSHEYAFINFKGGNSIFISQSQFRNSTVLRSAIRQIRNKFYNERKNNEMVCVGYGIVVLKNEHKREYRLNPKNHISIACNFVPLEKRD